MVIFVPHRKVALGAVERSPDSVAGVGLTDTGFMVGDPMPDLENHDLFRGILAEFESGGQCVGRLLIVIEHEMASDRTDLGRILHPQAPAGHINLVDSLVTQVAVAVIPKPVPVVMQPVSSI